MKKITGIRKRWMVNSISVVLFIVLLAVAAFSAAMGSYYYSTLSESLKQKAENAISSFDYYRTEAEYYDNARAVVAGEPNSDKLEVEYLDADGQQASPEQQEVLSRYVGWGGLANCFEQTSPHYEELKSLLDSEEYAAARASSLTAFYTPPVVIRGIYKALAQMGFTQGDILDKTTPRLIQFHTFKNAANPPFLGGFSIFSIVAA